MVKAEQAGLGRTETPQRGVVARGVARWTGNIILVAVSLSLALGLAEVYFRLFDPQSIVPRYVEVSGYGIRKNIGNVRGVMSTTEFRHGFSTNAQGFRGRTDYAPAKPPGTYRVIVLGDSVALGHGVEDDETFSAVAERELRTVRPVEVINMGVSGFGTAEELIQLDQIGWSYRPDLVVLTYFPNDPYNNVVSQLYSVSGERLVRNREAFEPALYIRDRLYSIPGYALLCDHSHVVNFLRSRFSAFFLEYLGRRHRTSAEIRTNLTEDEARLTRLLLDRVAAEAEARQVPLVILNVPVIQKGRVVQNFPDNAVPPGRAGAILVDVAADVYRGHPVEALAYEQDCHPKPFGHRLIAQELARVIRSRHWVER